MSVGKIFVFEGIEGSGKSTLVKKLSESLPNNFHVVRELSTPGITTSVVAPWVYAHDITKDAYSATMALHLLMLAREETLKTVILPLLEKGEHVLLDRFVISTLVYQGFYRAWRTRPLIRAFLTHFSRSISVARTFYLEIPPEEAYRRVLERARNGGDFDENDKKPLSHYEALYERYTEGLQGYNGIQENIIPKRLLGKITILDALLPIEDKLAMVQEKIMKDL